MAGLRERKKQATSRRIVEKATRLFLKNGYEETRIEDVAAEAELSIQTFYNYFASKADILLAIIADETEMVLAKGGKTILRPHADAAVAFHELVKTYYSNSFSATTRQMWRIAMARVMSDPTAEFSRGYIALDKQFTVQVVHFLTRMQSAGLIRSDVDPGSLGELLFNNVSLNFMEHVRGETKTIDEALATVRRQCAPVFQMVVP